MIDGFIIFFQGHTLLQTVSLSYALQIDNYESVSLGAVQN